MRYLFLFLMVFSVVASGAETKSAYSLQNLVPDGFSQYTAAELGGMRQYLRFKADKATHYLIYEEAEGQAPRKDVSNLRQAAMSGGAVTCDLEIQCDNKAFCTTDCRNMYYEFSNGSPAPGRNRCQLQSFDCHPATAAPSVGIGSSASFSAPPSGAPPSPGAAVPSGPAASPVKP